MTEKSKQLKELKMGLNITIRVARAIMLVGVSFGLLGFSLCAGIGLGYFSYLVSDTRPPSKSKLEKEINDIEEVSTLAYSNGKEIATIKSDLVRTRIKSADIAPIMKQAVVATEDEYFYKHKGVVPKAVFRALLGDALGIGASSGGSTLTQQLVKQQILSDDPTFKRKADEIMLALQIEKHFSKDEILTTYLNVSPFGRNNKGENIAGVEEAAIGIFGKHAKELSIPQAAFLAGLPQSPIVYSPYDATGKVKSDKDLEIGLLRKNNVLFNMYREGFINEKDYQAAKGYDLKKDFQQQGTAKQNLNDFLYYEVLDQATDVLARKLAKDAGLKEADMNDTKTYNAYYQQAERALRRSGYKVISTIDETIYNTMQQAMKENGYLLDRNNIYGEVETGNVLLDNQTGAILGFIGGRDFVKNQNNHALDTERSPGSTIKPLLVYGPAVDVGLIGTESQLSNFPTKYSNGQPILHVGNAGTSRYMSVREALEWSWNIPAYWTYQTLRSEGYQPEEYMKKMNFNIKDYSIESLPMGGGADVTVAQQTNGFQTLANNGEYHESYMIAKITDSNGKVIYEHKDVKAQVYSPATASIMNNMMRSVIDSKITTNFKNTMQLVDPTLAQADWVGKTGTSDDFKDVWLMVSTPKITFGSWAGYDQNQPMYIKQSDNVGSFNACVLSAVYQAKPEIFGAEERFTLSSDVIKSTVSSFTGELPGSVTINGKSTKTPGKSVDSYWAKNGAAQSAFEFGIGGTKEDYAKAWSRPDYKGSDPTAQDGLKKTN
ncbi:penicillin-binding protein [Pilibacter termitis]|uniref:Penicillin-binding protein n=1 Tax=Pilibacter termitis TaxID=263852 RepID=A0A1T4P4W7_9ENTE|nr:transglycosylase domain-containing protein [Pilibacter termitis]SJZ86367.1 penicillin-binding protein [Pilibacter termitis]